jgi:hypothetical protein
MCIKEEGKNLIMIVTVLVKKFDLSMVFCMC